VDIGSAELSAPLSGGDFDDCTPGEIENLPQWGYDLGEAGK
jgi:hypothetical protein